MKSLLLSIGNALETISSGDLTNSLSGSSSDSGTLSLARDLVAGLQNVPISSLSKDRLEIPLSGSREFAWDLNFGGGARLREAVNANARITVKLSVVIAPSAFRRLRATAFLSRNHPHALPHTEDQLNFQAFVRAVDSIYDHSGFKEEGFPNAIDKFSDWAHYNITVNDEEDSTRPPNRRLMGNPGVWPQSPGVRAANVSDTGIRAILRLYLIAAQRFMNLCEDLPALAADLDDAVTQSKFEELLNSIQDLVKKDAPNFPLFFTKPMLAALFTQMSGTIASIDGPAATEAITDSFSVSVVVV